MNEHIERLESMAADYGETWDLSPNDQAAIKYVLEKLAAAESEVSRLRAELAKREWIACSDKLPEPDKVVLTFSGDDGFIEAMSQSEFEGKVEWYEQDGDWWGNNVTHWMPLPDPPKEEV